MIRIFAHRAKIEEKENTLEGIKFFVKNKINIELDIRKNHELYLSHDKSNNGNLFEDACKILKKSKIMSALHIKETDAILDTIELIKENNLQEKCFIFSTNQGEKKLNHIDKKISIAKYVNKKIDTKDKILWCDESNEKWFNETIFKLQAQNCFLIAMSPELLEEKNMGVIKDEWDRLISLKFNGICSNFPIELKKWMDNRKK
jgi:hypothetical protein